MKNFPKQFIFLTITFVIAFSSHCASAAANCDDNAFYSPMEAVYETHEGKRILVLQGSFEQEDRQSNSPATSRVVGNAIRSGNYYEIWLCSPGGSVSEGKTVGRMFSQARAKIRVPDGYRCVSACTIAILGGYMRTIDAGAEFIVHASSSVMEINLESGNGDVGIIDIVCFTGYESICNQALALMNSSGVAACSETDTRKQVAGCYFFVTDYSNARSLDFSVPALLGDLNPDVLSNFVNGRGRVGVSSFFDLVQYYQEMLNDGDTRYVNSNAYAIVQRNFVSTPAYASNSSSRSFNQDFASLQATNSLNERLIVLQEILTQVELSGHQQVLDILREHESELGRGAKAALNIYEAMTTCRIQNSCYLETHRTARLGYHNFDHD